MTRTEQLDTLTRHAQRRLGRTLTTGEQADMSQVFYQLIATTPADTDRSAQGEERKMGVNVDAPAYGVDDEVESVGQRHKCVMRRRGVIGVGADQHGIVALVVGAGQHGDSGALGFREFHG